MSISQDIKLPEGIKATYSGYFVANRREGQGLEVTKTSKYEGEWKEGTKHGKGKIIYKSGAWYEGDWVEDLISGDGKYCD